MMSQFIKSVYGSRNYTLEIRFNAFFEDCRMVSARVRSRVGMNRLMYTTNIATARAKVNTAFSGHVLTHEFYLSNAVTNGKVTGSTAVNQDVVLMSERNVYGQSIMSSECANGSDNPGWYTYDRTQFPLFALAPEFIQKERSGYWLRDVVSATDFASVFTSGNADWYSAVASYRVRPAFSIS